MTEYKKAKTWREARDLTVGELSEAIGYSTRSIYWFERGETPPRSYKNQRKHDRKIDEWVWRRYKLACAGLDAMLTSKKGFDW